MLIVLDIAGLVKAVEEPLTGSGKASSRSVLGGEGDEVEEIAGTGASAVLAVVASKEEEYRAKRAYAYIVLALKTPELQELISDVPRGNAFEAWKRLMDHFQRSTQANKLALKAEFAALRQGERESD